MSVNTLARPLAARTAALPEIRETQGEGSIIDGVTDAAFDALDRGQTHYTDRPGIKPLRERAAARIGKRYGVELSADEVTITCGATEARYVIIKQLVKPGGKILCAGDPAAIAGAAALIGAEVTTDPDSSGISLLYVSAATPAETVKTLAAKAGEHGWWIAFDMATDDGGGDYHPARDAKLAEKTITIGSASPQLPGWRVGWLAGSKVANKLRAYKQSMTICTPSISQWAALGVED